MDYRLHPEKTVNKMKIVKDILIDCNEAIAYGSMAAGVDFVSHYPGSPVNFIEKHLKKLDHLFNSKIAFNDSLNEHIAALSAGGASFSGARSLCIMKHVGLNIAADPLNYLGYTGVKGGMVIIVGTDPGANSSTGEEDVHWYAPQFNFPVFEPTSVKECFEYTRDAFDISEKYEIPVMIFVPGRLAYNQEMIFVDVESKTEQKEFYFKKDRDRYINVGNRAVRNHKLLLEKIQRIQKNEKWTKRAFNKSSSIGIITRGLSYPIVYETINDLQLIDQVDLLNLDLVFPIHKESILDFVSNKKHLVFIEDQDGFIENQVKMECFNELNCKVNGKDVFPKYGEISIAQVRQYLSELFDVEMPITDQLQEVHVPERIGSFCEGCPHTGSYFSIDSVIKEVDGIIGGDIGCSSLPPFRADWLLCMNAGIGISQGMAQLIKTQPIISTGGDGSFFHTGLISLQNAVLNKINIIHMVFDNRSIAMTGHQESPTGKEFDHHKLLESIGVDKIIDVSPYNPKDFIEKIKNEIDGKGVRVFWVKGACVLAGNDYIESRRNILYPEIDNSKCDGCSVCYKDLACPAIIDLKTGGEQELKIDLDRCVRCGVCHEICPNDAISINYV